LNAEDFYYLRGSLTVFAHGMDISHTHSFINGISQGAFSHVQCLKKTGTLFVFCYNFVSRDQILLIFGSLVAKEICNRKMFTDLKETAGSLR